MKVMNILSKGLNVIKTPPKIYNEYFYHAKFNKIVTQTYNSCTALKFIRIDESNYRCIDKIREKGKAECFLRMHKENQYCLGAFVDGEIVGHAVMVLPIAKHNQVYIKTGGFIHFCYVEPQYRGKGIYPCMLKELMARTNQLYGIDSFAISTSPDNTSSQRGLSKVGFIYMKKQVSVCWWRLTLGKVRV